jgi:hypothetical protein
MHWINGIGSMSDKHFNRLHVALKAVAVLLALTALAEFSYAMWLLWGLL